MNNKEQFLKEEFVNLLADLDYSAAPVFGKMNVHQMIEHMAYSFRIASGKLLVENKQDDNLTAKMYRFMMSDKPFRDNTPNPNLSDDPIPTKFTSIKESLNDLKLEVDYFFSKYEEDDLRIENPFFGFLDRTEQIHLLHKHALHHLRQFGV